MKSTLQAPVRKHDPLATGAAILIAAFLLGFGLLHIVPGEQERASAVASAASVAPTPTTSPAAAPGASKAPAARVIERPKPLVREAIYAKKKPRSPARSAWSELGTAQQQALAPLASTWDGMSRFERREWLAMSKNFPSMPLDEQAKLYSRMVEWASLSPQQRTQARLNFADTEELPTEEKEAKWKAYQALSPEEKRKLEARAPARIKGAAQALQPVPRRKMRPMQPAKPISAQVQAPAPAANPNPGVTPPYPPSIMATGRLTDPRTLLPLAQPAAPVPTAAASR